MESREQGQPAAGELYRHFKGKLYQIIGMAKHSETSEDMVVYQALYGSYDWYVRPLSMFTSMVDAEKYPEYTGKRRFERIEKNTAAKKPADGKMQKTQAAQETLYTQKTPETQESVSIQPGEVFMEQIAEEDGNDSVRADLMQFLDAETVAEKREVLRHIRKNMDDELLTGIELSMDLIPQTNSSMERRLDLVEQYLDKRARYENGRLR